LGSKKHCSRANHLLFRAPWLHEWLTFSIRSHSSYFLMSIQDVAAGGALCCYDYAEPSRGSGITQASWNITSLFSPSGKCLPISS
jgi:hypothetical protein